MESVQQKARRQQQLEELSAAAGRALAAQPALHFRGGRVLCGDQPLLMQAPHLRVDPGRHDLVAYRGMIDGVALRLRCSDPVCHQAMQPSGSIARLLFEVLEQFRVESLAPVHLPGVKRNLRLRFDNWLREFHDAGMTGSAIGVLMFTVFQMARAQISGEPVLEETEGLIEATRAGIAPLIGVPLAALKKTRHDQRAFAVHARAIAEQVAALIEAAQTEPGASDSDDDDANDPLAALALLLVDEEESASQAGTVVTGAARSLDDEVVAYRVYSRRHDQVVDIATTVRPALLMQHRERLDRLVASQAVNSRRMIRQLTALLAAPARDDWVFGEEHGHIDGRRLSQVVTSPAERRVFRLEREVPVCDAVFSLLIDCSGSMKAHIEPVAALADILCRAFEQAGARTEVLGFTTGGWNGGRVRQEWIDGGCPENPGRIAELTHLVFKSADRPWRRARRGIAGLFKLDYFREGVDGEAVEWACRRLLSLDARRRILIVISDGCPMERATALANHEQYLDSHLRQVVARHASAGDVEILGLGVGLDLSGYYSRCLATDLHQGLDNALLFDIVKLIAGRHRR